MIIGLTVRDNDFQDELTAFAKRLAAGMFIMEKPPADDDPSQTEWYGWFRETEAACRAAVKKTVPDEAEKQAVIEAVARSWKAFVKDRESADYLSDRLEVTVPDSIDSEWKNGEQFYVFPTSYEEHVLCF